MPHSKRTLGGVVGGILGLVGLSAVAGLLVTATVTPAIALSGYTASGAMTMFENIPADLEVDQPMLPTTIYVENDKGKNVELATFYDQNRIPLEYEDLPQVVIDAVLSSEDPRFYDHGGVDLIGTSRALLQNAGGGSTQGASTITQQFVKNVLVQRCEAGTSEDLPDDFDSLASEDQQAAIIDCYNEQTDSSGTEGYQRKLQEMRFAIAIEKKYTKEQILLGYLNEFAELRRPDLRHRGRGEALLRKEREGHHHRRGRDPRWRRAEPEPAAHRQEGRHPRDPG